MFTLIRASFTLIPSRDLIAQPITSKVVKQVILRKARPGSILHKLLADDSPISRAPEKPVKMSMISRAGRPLWNWVGGYPVVLRGGEEYGFDVVYVDSPIAEKRLGLGEGVAGRVIEELTGLEGRSAVYGSGEATISLTSITAVSSDQLGADLRGSGVRLEFQTPTLLQYPKPSRLRIRESVHSLYPTPHLLIMNLAQKWEMYESGKRPVGIPAYIPFELREVDHGIRPITIPLNGVGERGFTGWAVYRLAAASQERLGSYLRLLHMATFTGVGHSTSLGLGQVALSMLNHA
ncbi:CRISPR system precrRNA processing endoribonuclease RAMP protein Cas6 [Thermocladium modestius]|uniref:CRISPR system precrRNA processing endoribonuclease RAMP protein Cas6 n=1 Tax=Thermocladium modestius TaxID=62609 RepID=UPI001667118A|nr:CRISPR system precrRNA processing endoribonuclease RAMP protein Cas6 [Thermocladium modestius]